MNKKSLLKNYHILIVSIFIAFLTLLVIITLCSSYIKYQNAIEEIESKSLESIKKVLKLEVNVFKDYIKTSRSKLESEIKTNIKEQVEVVYGIASNLASKYKNKDELRKVIVESIREYKYNNKRDYFFIVALDGKILLYPTKPWYEGKNFLNSTNEYARKVIGNLIAMGKRKEDGFSKYKWMKKNRDENIIYEKISYIKYFEPLNCFIGTGIYYDDFEEDLKAYIIKEIEKYKFGSNRQRYIFATTYDGISLTMPAKNKYLYDVKDKNGLKVVQELIKKAKEGGGYLRYIMPIGPDKDKEKISYVAPIKNWNWYIGTGETLEKVNKQVIESRKRVLNQLYWDLFVYFLFALIIVIVHFFIFERLKKKSNSKIELFINMVKDLIKSNKEINLKKVELYELEPLASNINELIKNKNETNEKLLKNELILAEQSRKASMGEMIGNIAHQWRQPLSVITTVISGLRLKSDYESVSKDDIEQSSETIIKQAQYLSQTIDSFRDFIKGEKAYKQISIKKTIENTLSLLEASLRNNYVNLVLDIENDIFVTGNKQELTEAFINIINNSKDALKSNEDIKEDKFIFIKTKKIDKDTLELNILDNADGIDSSIIERIFDPYFTTKHKSVGTGLGLSMADKIITERHKFNLSVHNKTFDYKGRMYKGACFKIIIKSDLN